MRIEDIKKLWIDFLVEQGFTHAITMKPNDRDFLYTLGKLHNLFVKVHMLVDRHLLGRRFNTASRAGLRSQAVGIVEGLPFSGHLHGAFRIAPANWAAFERLFADDVGVKRSGIWRKLVPSGSAVVERIGDPEGWHDYTFKNVWETGDLDRVVLLPLASAESTITPK